MLNNQNYDVNQLDNLPLNIIQSRSKSFSLMKLVRIDQGKTQKQPIDIHADSNSDKLLAWKQHPEYLVDFNTAVTALKGRNDNKLRLGVLLQHHWEGNKDLIAIDIDHRPDLVEQIKNGQITSNDIQAQVVQFGFKHNFYIEISQSGEGLHLLQIGHKYREKPIRNDKFEYYDSSRWICLTGNSVNNVKKLGTDDVTFRELESLMFPERRAKARSNITTSTFNSSDLIVDEIIQKAKNAKDGQKFQQLYNGASPSGDASADDLAFVEIIAFWSQDPVKIDAVFRKSGRMRDKWDEIHYSNPPETYGQHIIKKVLQSIRNTYHPIDNRPAYDQIDKSKLKSNADLFNALKHVRSIWDKQHTFKDKQGNIHHSPIKTKDIIDILINVVNFAIIYNNDPKDDAALYYYNYDEGVYSQNSRDLHGLILAVCDITASTVSEKVRNNILNTIFSLHSAQVPVVQNLISSDKGKYLLTVGNGILDLKTKELTPYNPKLYITSKINTDYNPNASQEPKYNGWCWSDSLKEIADGDVDKLTLLWQVCKAAIIGAFWLRQAVLLIDDGHGMTGKSTFEEALIGVVGKQNTANLRLFEFADETKLLDAVDKRLIVGDDNDVNKIINRYDYLNPVISSEYIRVKRYYQKSQSTKLHVFVLQSCNGIPPFQNATQAFLNRMILIQFDHHHNSKNLEDWRVKNDYIHRKDFQQWLLWFIVNKVTLGNSLKNTQENIHLLNDTKIENDTIQNFIINWMPKIKSTVIPSSWLYSYYSTACVIDQMNKTLSQRRFSRELMNNETFSSHWDKKAKRPSSNEFLLEDAQNLVSMCNSTHWTKGSKVWFPIIQKTISNPKTGTSKSYPTILESDYSQILKNFHGQCFLKK